MREPSILVEKYAKAYPNWCHTDIAKVLKQNEKLAESIRTIRRYVSEYREQYMEKAPEPDPAPGDLYSKIFEQQEELQKLYNQLDPQFKQSGIEPPSKKTEESEVLPSSWHFRAPGDYLVLGCVHAPFHNERFMSALLNLCKENRGDFAGLVLNGDFVDLNTLSNHDVGKMPLPGIDLGYEYEASNELLDQFCDVFEGKEKAFIEGNHEDRYWRAMEKPDNVKLAGELRRPADALNLYKRGFHVHEGWKDSFIKLGNDLEVMHGIYTNEHVAKKHVDVFRTNVMFAHCHRIQRYESQLSGYAIGAGADFANKVFDFAPRGMKKPWANGCAIVHVDANGEHHVSILRFKSGKLHYNGQTYTS